MSVFKNFKNTPGRPPIGRQALSVIFFSNLQRSPWRKKKQGLSPPNGRQDPVAPGVDDRGLSPVGGAIGPLFFFSRDFVANLKKKNYI